MKIKAVAYRGLEHGYHEYFVEIDETKLTDTAKKYVNDDGYCPSDPIGTTDGFPRRRTLYLTRTNLSPESAVILINGRAEQWVDFLMNWEESKRKDPRVHDNPWPST